MTERELNTAEILALKVGDKIRIGDTTTAVDYCYPGWSFHTTDWFIDAYGLKTTIYGLNDGAEEYDIGKVPVYLVTE